MKLHFTLIWVLFGILIIFGYMNPTYAEDGNTIPAMKILWQREITPDANLDCSLGPVALDKTNKKLLITGTFFRPKKHLESKFWLLEVDTNNGTLDKTMFFKNVTDSRTAAMPASLLISSIMVSEDGDATLVGKFDSFILPTSIMKISRSGNTSKSSNFPSKNNIEGEFSQILGKTNLSSGNLLLISRNKSLVTNVDSKGTILWEKNYKIGQRKGDWFSDGVVVTDKGDFVMVGCSASPAEPGSPFPEAKCDDFIVLCDSQGNVLAKDIFPGNLWSSEQPLVCRTSSGNFVVVYGKGMAVSDINIRGYSPDLKLLWEKPVVKSKQKKPSSFKIAATPQGGFIVAANVDFGNLMVYQYDEKGNQIANFSMDKEIWLINIALECVDKQAIVVFQTRPDFEQNQEISRLKIIALELK